MSINAPCFSLININYIFLGLFTFSILCSFYKTSYLASFLFLIMFLSLLKKLNYINSNYSQIKIKYI